MVMFWKHGFLFLSHLLSLPEESCTNNKAHSEASYTVKVSKLSLLFSLKCWNISAATCYLCNRSVARVKVLWEALIHGRKALVVPVINVKQSLPSKPLVSCFVSLVINLSVSCGIFWWLFPKSFILMANQDIIHFSIQNTFLTQRTANLSWMVMNGVGHCSLSFGTPFIPPSLTYP